MLGVGSVSGELIRCLLKSGTYVWPEVESRCSVACKGKGGGGGGKKHTQKKKKTESHPLLLAAHLGLRAIKLGISLLCT